LGGRPSNTLLVAALAALSCWRSAAAQLPPSAYARAEQFLGWNLTPLVARDSVVPVWLTPYKFWYRNRLPSGHEYLLVDARAGTQEPLTDESVLSAARATPKPGSANEILSPDGRWAAFIRQYDLWVRDTKTGEEVRLTVDGKARYGYATDSEGWRRSERPVLAWSPDSRRIATYRLDERRVGDMYLVRTKTGRPELYSYPYALPGDSVIPTMERFIFDVTTRSATRIDFAPDAQRFTTCCGTFRDTVWSDVQWADDGSRFYFASVSRDYKRVALVEADATTGRTRVLLREEVPTYFESNERYNGVQNWRVISGGREVLWFSQRDGWGHLYLYNAATGALENRVTQGQWLVGDVLFVDPATRTVLFTAYGRELGRNPYYRFLYRVGLDGTGLELLTPEDANHEVRVSPTGEYLIDTFSRTGAAPVTVLRDAHGQVRKVLQQGDIARLLALGWRAPESFVTHARDGNTPLHGLLFRPTGFVPGRKYPLIVYIYPGPQQGSVTTYAFAAGYTGHPQALAELGFIVMQLDGLGTPLRSKAFHDAWYAQLGDGGIDDQVTSVRQLAARYPEIDLDRVGIYGHSGGGFASTAAILKHPELFKVAVSGAGNHDNRGYTGYWGERYQGLLARDSADDNYRLQANPEFAAGLKGKLLLMFGTMDDNVHPNLTLQVVDALISGNADFDLLALPNRNHRFSSEPYVIRRTWDYFVKNLLGLEPPTQYRLRGPSTIPPSSNP
jgi:dipeptidyl-peptidase-4